jgi:hypothetical protein
MKIFLDTRLTAGYQGPVNGRTASASLPTCEDLPFADRQVRPAWAHRGNGGAARDDVTFLQGRRDMKNLPITRSPTTTDTGRIRFGGGWRLPSAKPVR